MSNGPSAMLVALWLALPTGAWAETPVAGWVERVGIVEAGLALHAKLDTGADNSSLNAHPLVLEARDGITWAHFTLETHDGSHKAMALPVTRMARIKRQTAASQKRPVVRLTLCVGAAARTVDVNLVDRERFDYPLLVGRSFLRSLVLVDPGRTYLMRPECLD